jgi:hypothetical protein
MTKCGSVFWCAYSAFSFNVPVIIICLSRQITGAIIVSVCLFVVCLFVCLSVCLSVCLFVCLTVHVKIYVGQYQQPTARS